MEYRPKVAFVCVHNSCRSQIAEALGKYYADGIFDSYSAGTEVNRQINKDAVRIVKELYGIDMMESQYPKSIDSLPEIDILVSMGCEVSCPHLEATVYLDFGLADPTGKDDDFFKDVISEIDENIRCLVSRLNDKEILP